MTRANALKLICGFGPQQRKQSAGPSNTVEPFNVDRLILLIDTRSNLVSEESPDFISSMTSDLAAVHNEPARKGEIKGFESVPDPQRAAEEWFELFRSG